MAVKKAATKVAKKVPAKKVAKKATAPAKKAAAPKVKKETKQVIKSSKSGNFVSKAVAKADPDRTMAVTVPVDKTPHINEAKLKREAAAKKAAAPAAKTAAKKAVPAKKVAVKKAAAKKGADPTWRKKEPQPVQAFGQSYGSVEAAAIANHVAPDTLTARAAAKDGEFAHVKFGRGKKKKV